MAKQQIKIGMRAMGSSHAMDSNYSLLSIESRRDHLWIIGVVIRRHEDDGTGECFDLRYENGSLATYHSEEITIV